MSCDEMEKQTGPVKLSNPMQEGIDAAKIRIEKLTSQTTLVSQIADDVWEKWDASEECALVSDQDYQIPGGFIRFAA